MRTILPDGSLDPAADFQDDGASFRVRREISLAKRERRSMWSEPHSSSEAITQGVKISVALAGVIFMLFVGFALGGLLMCFG